MNAIVIDDEQRCLTALCNDLKLFCPGVAVQECCSSAREGMLAIRRHDPDLIFLDIEMPWMNGFELLETLGKIDFQVIFTTAYDRFAIRALRMSAIDYLLKPVDRHELVAAVSKAASLSATQSQPQQTVDNLLQNLRQNAVVQKLAVPTRDGYEFVPAGDIEYCRAEGAYTNVILQDGRKLVLSKSLSDTEQQLPEDLFIRVHQSYLANVNHIVHFRRGDANTIQMQNGDELAVSKAKRDILLQKLGVKR